MSDIPEVDLIAYAITETFGERCPDHEETCPCCKAWKQYDAIEARIAAAEQRGVEKERERCAQVAEEVGEAYGEDETGWLDCSETIAAAIRKEG